MKLAEELKALGWTEDLISAVSAVAKRLRPYAVENPLDPKINTVNAFVDSSTISVPAEVTVSTDFQIRISTK